MSLFCWQTMKKTIAVAGKGGTGKTTFASLIVRYIVGKIKKGVLAIDADPNENLGLYLGLKTEKHTIMDMVEGIKNNPDSVPLSMSKEDFLNLRIQQAIIEKDGLDFLVMGRPEGPGCYCYANNLLKGLIEKIKNTYDYTVIDNEAGLEHLSRRIAPAVDILFIICGMDLTSFNTAKNIVKITKGLNFDIKKKVVVSSRINEKRAFELKALLRGEEIDFFGRLEEDKNLLEVSLGRKSIFDLAPDSISIRQSREIFDKIL